MNDGGAGKATTSVAYKVSVTADGYSGSVDTTVVIIKAAPTNTNLTTTNLAQPATIQAVKVVDSDDVELTDDTTGTVKAAAGEKLTVKTVPAAAAAAIDWTWAVGDGEVEDTATGSSFVVPAGANGKYISLGGSVNASANPAWVNTAGLQVLIAATDYGSVAGAAPVGTDLTSADAAGILRSIGKLTVTYNTKADGSGTVLEKPEVGGFMIINAEHNPGLKYEFSYATSRDYKGDNAVNGAADDLEYTSVTGAFQIGAGAIGQKIKVKVTPLPAATSYKTAFESTYTSDVVVASSRTIKEFKVLAYQDVPRGTATSATWFNDDNADAYKSGQQVKSLKANAGNEYAIVALDSNGDLVTLGAEAVLLDGNNQIQHKTFTKTNSDGDANSLIMAITGNTPDLDIAANQKITVMVVPNGVDYVGDTLEYEFSTYVSN